MAVQQINIALIKKQVNAVLDDIAEFKTIYSDNETITRILDEQARLVHELYNHTCSRNRVGELLRSENASNRETLVFAYEFYNTAIEFVDTSLDESDLCLQACINHIHTTIEA